MVPRKVLPAKAGVLAVAALMILLGGCSRPIDGTPVAAPGEVGMGAGADLLETTCREYVPMGQSGRREVMTAIGEAGNRLVATNPDLWAGVAAALCTFADPSAPVKDVVTGGVR
ncbi:hypothetical protein [Mycolicibacterium sp.]|uniref:hypothetical protein n=1 Tax=Mycolicibacterium sp. TaxID=2320850 RepID=UPI0025F70857|nr:hypothetical protein [Mycolicibacterium sp.]MCB9410672.1 hypothetical protein [Mycolicibacterium sp.]